MRSEKIVLSNSVGQDDAGFYIIHSPSRWSEGVSLLSSWFAYYPWELAYTAALLKQKTDNTVKLLDPCLNRWNKHQMLAEILAEEPDWFVIESSTRTIKENLWVVQNLKKTLPVKVVFTGQHGSVFPQELIAAGADYVCIGEYEMTLLDLFQNKDSAYIAGLYPNSRRPLIDVSSLPWPEDTDVKRIDYAVPGEPSSEYIEVQAYASRGCRGNCSFCVAKNIYYAGGTWRRRNIPDIVDEIGYLKNRYPKMEGIFFDEETHNGDKNFIKEFTSALKSSGLADLKYEAMCDMRLLDEDILEKMKSAGYYKIRFGIETASETLSERTGKPVKSEKVINLLKQAKNIGLKSYVTFMFGLPGANIEEEQKTINFMERLIKDGLVANVQISTATPFPGTPFYNEVKEKGYLIDNEPHCFDGANSVVVNYPQYSKKQIEEVKRISLIKRDHLFFKKNIKENPFRFLYSRYRRYGFKLLMEKGLRRIKTEIDYFNI